MSVHVLHLRILLSFTQDMPTWLGLINSLMVGHYDGELKSLNTFIGQQFDGNLISFRFIHFKTVLINKRVYFKVPGKIPVFPLD